MLIVSFYIDQYRNKINLKPKLNQLKRIKNIAKQTRSNIPLYIKLKSHHKNLNIFIWIQLYNSNHNSSNFVSIRPSRLWNSTPSFKPSIHTWSEGYSILTFLQMEVPLATRKYPFTITLLLFSLSLSFIWYSYLNGNIISLTPSSPNYPQPLKKEWPFLPSSAGFSHSTLNLLPAKVFSCSTPATLLFLSKFIFSSAKTPRLTSPFTLHGPDGFMDPTWQWSSPILKD